MAIDAVEEIRGMRYLPLAKLAGTSNLPSDVAIVLGAYCAGALSVGDNGTYSQLHTHRKVGRCNT